MQKADFDRLKARFKSDKITAERFFYRPVSFFITPIFHSLGISGNQATLIRIPIVLLGSVLFTLGQDNFLAGYFVFLFARTMDCVDGNLAVLKKNTNYIGKFLDSLVDNIYGVLLPISLSVGIWHGGQSFFGSSPALFLLIGGFCAVFNLFSELVTTHYRRLKIECNVLEGPTGNGNQKKVVNKKSILYKIFNLSKEFDASALLLLAFPLFLLERADVFLCLQFLFRFTVWSATLISYSGRAPKELNVLRPSSRDPSWKQDPHKAAILSHLIK